MCQIEKIAVLNKLTPGTSKLRLCIRTIVKMLVYESNLHAQFDF